jgi:hypothetical protein
VQPREGVQPDYLGIIANTGSTGAEWLPGDVNGDALAEVTANLGAGTSLTVGPSLL